MTMTVKYYTNAHMLNTHKLPLKILCIPDHLRTNRDINYKLRQCPSIVTHHIHHKMIVYVSGGN